MQRDRTCPRCGEKKLWSIRRGKLRCSACRYEWTLGKLPLQLERREWLKLLHWFLRGLPATAAAQETGLHHQRVFRALTYVRLAMQKDIPNVFSVTVEVDETPPAAGKPTSVASRQGPALTGGRTSAFLRGKLGVSVVEEQRRHRSLGYSVAVEKCGHRSFLM